MGPGLDAGGQVEGALRPAEPAEVALLGLMQIADIIGDRDDPSTSPTYSEVVKASVERGASELRFVVRFHETLPTKLSNENEKFTAGFNLETNEGRAFALIGVVDDEGWDSSFQETRGKSINGRLAVKGRELRFIVRAAEFGRFQTFQWAAGGALTRSMPESAPIMLGWDVVPNEGPTTFPESGSAQGS